MPFYIWKVKMDPVLPLVSRTADRQDSVFSTCLEDGAECMSPLAVVQNCQSTPSRRVPVVADDIPQSETHANIEGASYPESSRQESWHL